MNILLIAQLTFREARRRKVMWAALIVGAAFLILYGVGLHFIYQELQRQFARTGGGPNFSTVLNMLSMMALYAVNFLIIVMTVLTSVDTIAGEVSSGAIHAIATKPIRRAEILLGKWLGFAVMLSLYAIFMIGGVILMTRLVGSYTPLNPVRGAALMIFEGLILLTLSMLGGTFLSTLANGVMVFGLFGVAFVGGWVEQFGSMMQSQVAVNIGIFTSLLMPSETIWRNAAYLMQPALLRNFNVSPFGSASQPSGAMMVYTAIYIVGTLLLALRVFSKRDL
jgi:Cu-processing system permease protein